MKTLNETIFNALLRRKKQEKVNEDSIFLEYDFNGFCLSVFATKETNFEISEIVIDEGFRLTNSQLEQLQKIVKEKIIEMRDPVDEYFENGVKPENFC